MLGAMPPGSMQYTLVGFSTELDWRPLRFVKPIPLYSVCGACGLVRKKTALLPCMHALCESCYEQSARDGVHVCPLDGHQCEEEDVFLKEFPVDELLRREVKCWNHGSTCTAVLPASKITEHFQRECRHHSIRCPKCSAIVLCTDVCAHLEWECFTDAPPAEPEYNEHAFSREETAPATLLTSFRQILEQATEIKTLLERLVPSSGDYRDGFSELVHVVNNCQEALRELRQGISSVKDTVRQEVARVITEHRESAKKCSEEIAVFSEETKRHFTAGGDTMNTISNSMISLGKLLTDELAKVAKLNWGNDSEVARFSEGSTNEVEDTSNAMGIVNMVVPKQPDPQTSACEFVVKGVNSLEEKARKERRADFDSERVYLRGYCMLPGVQLYKSLGNVRLHALFRLHKGDMNDVVQWPFRHTIKLRVVHPKSGEEREIVATLSGFFSAVKRPEKGRVQAAYYSDESLLLEHLIRDGYVEDDNLHVKFELPS
ncbi:uncharacterized protein LOC144124640 [Amblyomma americanum]